MGAKTKDNYSKEKLIGVIYNNQRNSSRKRDHDMPKYTLDELRVWANGQQKFHKLYEIWQESGRDIDLVPSIDRKDNSKGYSFDNIQLMTWKENKDKEYLNAAGRVPIYRISTDYSIIKEYKDALEASKDLNINTSGITDVIIGKILSTNGMLFIALKDYSKDAVHKYVDKYKTMTKFKTDKTILVYNTNGELFKECSDVDDAADLVGVHKNNVLMALNGKTATAGGYIIISLLDYNEKILKERLSMAKETSFKRTGRPVLRYNSDGLLIKEYDNLKLASLDFKGATDASIHKAASGARTGYMNELFIFKDEFTPALLKDKLVKLKKSMVKEVYGMVINNLTGKKEKVIARSTRVLFTYLSVNNQYDEIKFGTLKDRIRNINNVDFGYL